MRPVSPCAIDFDLVAKLVEAQIVTIEHLQRLERKIDTMTESVSDALAAAVTTITTAVGDASAAIRDQATKLAQASSLNPGDVQSAADKLTQIAAGLESVVAAAGEPVTAPAAETPPASDAAPEAAPADAGTAA